MDAVNVLIMGAAGRDFHNFNVFYRNNPAYRVVCFTASQIPNIEGRIYPPELAGPLYTKGIPIYPESRLEYLISKHGIQEVVFSYSDTSFDYVMRVAARVNAAGASFKTLGYTQTALKSSKPVISVVAARTGSGKSQTSRRILELLKSMKKRTVAVRHPMPYGDLRKQVVQRFSKISDLKKYECTIEEMEEFEPHIRRGNVIYAGIDYEAILRRAEKEADVILWDGGNNDMPFFRADLIVAVVDPHRPGHETAYYPGLTNILLANVVVINKIDSANPMDINAVRNNVLRINPGVLVIEAASPISLEPRDGHSLIRGKKVLVVEDGPTLTHGEMQYGAGIIAAQKYNAHTIVDPRRYAVKSIADTYTRYPHIGTLLPAMGYGQKQIKDLEQTINRVPCDAVLIATPIDLRRLINIRKPTVRVLYELQEIGKPDLSDVLQEFFKR